MSTRSGMRIAATILLGAALVLAGCLQDGTADDANPTPSPPPPPAPSPTPTPNATHAVTIVAFTFVPADLTIKAGDEVCWTNRDAFSHTARSDPGEPIFFDTGNIPFGQTKCVTFATAGSVDYHCELHTSMTGSLTIE